MSRRRFESLLGHRVARDPVTRCVRDAARDVDARVWLVGGYVRDALLGRRSPDVDLIGGRRTSHLVPELQRRWKRRGFRFRKRGVTTWRFSIDDHRVDLVDAERRGLDSDLRRRDFTVNAIAFDLVEPGLVDPLNGLVDLRAGRLRLPRTGVIEEDPLRAIRAARFLAQLPGFRLSADARREARRVAPRARRVAPERVLAELDKLLAVDGAHRGLAAMKQLDLIPAVLPELVPLFTCLAGRERPNVWRHTLDAIELSGTRRRLPGASAVPHDCLRLLRWALLLHDVSKPETLAVRDDGRPTFHGHEVLGSRRAEAILERLRLPRHERRSICRLILLHLRPGHLADAGVTERSARRLVRDAGADLPLLVLHAACDALASGSPDADRRWRRLRSVLRLLLELRDRRERTPAPRLIGGRDVMSALGIPAGPLVGRILERIRERQEEGAVRTRREALAEVRRLGRQRG